MEKLATPQNEVGPSGEDGLESSFQADKLSLYNLTNIRLRCLELAFEISGGSAIDTNVLQNKAEDLFIYVISGRLVDYE